MELNRDETGTHSARKILRAQMAGALAHLEAKKIGDEHVHAARKDLKKARATLRLLRDAMGVAGYRRENQALRDIARPLSAARDGKMLCDTLEKVILRFGAPARAIPLEALRKVLRRERLRARRAITASTQRSLRVALRQVQERSVRWRLGDSGWRVLGAGLTRVYARGRRGLEASRAKRSAENLHEWRKQVKYLWHQLQLFEPLWPALIGELADQAHRLADYLGEDHDLAVLRAMLIEHQDSFPDPVSRSALIAWVDRYRVELQDKAFVLGARIYEERPKEFENRFGRYWSDWQREERLLAG